MRVYFALYNFLLFLYSTKYNIMEKLYTLHDSYISRVPMAFTRSLMEKINWNSRLIGIKGPKGVGKSTLMQQYIRKNFNDGDRHVLYCSADAGYFTEHTLVETATDSSNPEELHYLSTRFISTKTGAGN